MGQPRQRALLGRQRNGLEQPPLRHCVRCPRAHHFKARIGEQPPQQHSFFGAALLQ
ncbi:hypothetical protein [Streptomyces sp. 11-1-2]|uniref:hypothetical protein n=1 Tax=unclassified Streptomyces TaxID=2593676 RepID=UPI0013C4FAB3